ncbi:GLPGLI family protein [Cellulophaga lytica]|nr:GLPGLI family protein [Cellulophaga lytica]
MKHLLYLILLLPLISLAQIHSGTITYGITVNKQEDSSYKGKQELKALMMSVSKAATNVNYKLQFNAAYAKFNVDNKLAVKDSYLENLASIISGNKGTYYTSLPQKKQIINTDAGINIDAPIENEDWDLTKETKKIGDFLCYKATKVKTVPKGDVTVVAWYTPEIPFAYGPNNYAGQLPGLILELNGLMATYKAKEIKLNPKKAIVIKWPKEKNNMSVSEYKKAGDKLYQDRKDERKR